MNPTIVDRHTFLKNLRISKLLTNQQYYLVVDRLGEITDSREIAKALASWKLVTKFQAKMLLVGRNTGFFIGPYRILDQLGRGGMGRVYKAVHQTMNRVVALKVLAPQLVKTARAHQLFLREVQAAAHLSHPNIVMAYDANEHEGRHYLSMEYVDGPNLERHVRKNGPMPIGMACEVIFQAANGLQYAFEKGVVHRDIKPANLLLAMEQGHDAVQVKILDFGLARFHHGEHTDADLGKENSVMGTPDFLSPEQARDLNLTDVRSDLYSLGCTFYYILTGEVPFPGGGNMEKLIRHNQETARPIEELRPDVPPAIAEIVRKLMAKKPAERHQTPDELMDALAPHAAPSILDWPIMAPQSNERASQEEIILPDDVQGDTEPKAQSATQIGDEESILEWVDAQSRERRRFRRIMLGVAVGVGTLLFGAAAGATWWILTH